MWNLRRLEVADYRDHLDVAFPEDSDSQRVSEAEKDLVLAFYENYETALGRPSPALRGENTSQPLRQEVHDAYGLVQDGRRLAKLRSDLKLLAESCPYCGYGPIEELDHLLQRAHFKLFSIFPLNLVPSCGTCNKGKRRIPSDNVEEHQLHVYLEDVSDYDFLRADVTIDVASGALKPRYSIVQSPGMPVELYQRLVFHLQEFDLQARYEKQMNIFLGELEYPITSSYEEGGAQALRRVLTGTAQALRRRFGANDWRTALMTGLAACAEFYEGGFRTALGLPQVNVGQVA